MATAITVLSIDDSRAVHAFLDRAFAQSAHQFVHALSGKEGIRILEEGKTKVDVILLDWEMPEQNGPEVLQEIKKRGILIPVLMMTSKNNTQDISKMIEAGAAEYIMKPFTPEVIVDKIRSVLGD